MDFQTDGNGEFTPPIVALGKYGILHRLMCPYTSEQNGVIECCNKRIVERGNVLLSRAR